VEGDFFVKVITDVVSPHQARAFHDKHQRALTQENAPVCLYLSEAFFNDGLFQLHKSGKLALTVNSQSPPWLYNGYRLGCVKERPDCLGSVAPDLATKYGLNATVSAHSYSTKQPTVTFTDGKAVFHGYYAIDLNITRAGTTVVESEPTVTVDVVGSATVKFDNAGAHPRLTGYAKADSIKIQVGGKDDPIRQKEVGGFITIAFEGWMKGDLLKKGIELKFPFGIGAEHPYIHFSPGQLVVCTGFKWINEADFYSSVGQAQPGLPACPPPGDR